MPDRLTIPPIRTPLTNYADGSPVNGSGTKDGPITTEKQWYYYWRDIGFQINAIARKIAEFEGGGGGTDVVGPVTEVVSAHEIGGRYADDNDRLVHLTLGFIPICPTPQNVTYLVSPDDGATWTWIGSQRMLDGGQELRVDRLAPGQDSTWKIAAVAGNLGGDPSPIADADLDDLYPGVVRSASFPVAGLATPAATQGITATIGPCSDVIAADGFTHYGRIEGLLYTDPIGGIDFFVRITVQIYGPGGPLAAEQAYGGTQITGGTHTEEPLLITYVPGLSFVRYRFYTANRNSQGGGDFSDPATNTLQQVKFNGATTTADHYDVPVTIPPFEPPDPGGSFNVISVAASEVGPKYQDEKAGLHTTIGVTPVIDVDFTTPRTVTIWFDFGSGQIVWQGWYSLTAAGQTIRIGDSTLGTDGVRKSGDIWVPANATQGNWKVYCGAGRIDNGMDATAYATFGFTVVPVTACLPDGTTNAQFLPSPDTGDQIIYNKYDPGVWYWEYYCLQWTPPNINKDPNYWFTLITVQKGATIGGVWTPAPDPEGINESPTLSFLGRNHAEILQLPGLANDQVSVLTKFGTRPATWVIPPAQKADLSPNVYREFRFLLYNVSRLGTDTSGSGGAGTYTLQTSCWPGGKSFFILTPQPKVGDFDMRAANPATITLPLTGGNGQPLGIPPGGIGGDYLGPQSVHAINMAKDSITAANQALAANSVVDPNLVSMSISKVTYGTSIFAGDVILSRGPNLPVIVLQNSGIFLYGQADASSGAAGLTSKPYVAIQNSAIGLFQGGVNGGSVFLDGASNAITIYNKNGDLTKPYFTVTATGLSLVDGSCSMAVNSNALAFIDKVNGNRLDLNSAGVAISKGLNADGTVAVNANQVVLLNNKMQFILAGVSRITIDASGGATDGITLSNGGTSSVTITSSQVEIIGHTTNSKVTITPTGVTIVGGQFTSPAINGGSLNIATNQGTVTINNTTNGIQVSAGSGPTVQTTRVSTSVITIADATYTSALTQRSLVVGSGGTPNTTCGFDTDSTHTPNGLIVGGHNCIGLDGILKTGVQCNDHVFASDFGIQRAGTGLGIGVDGSFVAGGKTVTVIGGIITSIV